MVLSVLRSRRSIRQYQNKPVEKEKIDNLIEMLLRAPSSRSLNPWEYILVTDQSLLQKLSESKPHGTSFLRGAPLGIVICGDPEKSDVWIEDCSIAAIIAQLSAESMGLGSCWIQVRNRYHSEGKTSEAYVRNILNLPSHYKVESIIAIGYPAETLEPHSQDELDFNKIHYQSFHLKT